MRKLFVILLILIPLQRIVAQPLSDSYYRENPSWLDAELWASDGEYYTLRRDSYSPFERFALYGFSLVDYSFRGEARGALTTRLGQMDVASPLERYPDYALLSLLRRVPSSRQHHYTTSLRGHGADYRTQQFDPLPLASPESSRLRLQLASRSYRLGVGYAVDHHRGDSVAYSLALGGRWGDDGVVEGLFSNEAYLWLAGQWRREVQEGLTSSLQVALMVAPQMRSQRSWNTLEVMHLACDGYYNSYWGYQNGRVRSSRIRREAIPTLYAAWDLDDGYILSNVNISTLVRAGRKSRSVLDWADAPNPSPDYWGYLPSGQSDPAVALLAEEVWREGDVRYTQIDWQSLYDINRHSSVGAHYALMDERRDLFAASVDASAALLGMQGGRLGVRGGLNSAHDYNTPRDWLGAEHLGEGFSLYDYRLFHTSWEVYGWLYGDFAVGRLFGAVELGTEGVEYRSEATSRRYDPRPTTTFALKGGWSRSLGAEASVGVVGRYELSAPFVEERYGSLEGAALLNPYATTEGRLMGEAWCELEVGMVRLNLSLYANYLYGGSAVERFWYDPTDQYATLLAGGMNGLNVGAELSARVALARDLSLEGHFALGRYGYTSDGVAKIVDHDTGALIVNSTRLNLEGLRSSSSPGVLAALVAKYTTPRGWLLGLEGVVVADRVVEPSLLLTSDHLRSMAHTPEEQRALTEQASLGAASSLNAFIYREFAHSWSLSLSVRNLLNDSSALSGGYQPSRVIIKESKSQRSIAPHATRYQTAYPRHLYITVGYEF